LRDHAAQAAGRPEFVGGVEVLLGQRRVAELHAANGAGSRIERRSGRDGHGRHPRQELGEGLDLSVFEVAERHHGVFANQAGGEVAAECTDLLLQQHGLELRQVVGRPDTCGVRGSVDARDQRGDVRRRGGEAGGRGLAGRIEVRVQDVGAHGAGDVRRRYEERMGEGPVPLEQRVGVVVGAAEHDIEAVVGEAVAGGEIGGSLRIAAVSAAVAPANLEAVELLLQDEVHYTADGVGAVDRRGAIGQHLHALDGAGGDLVDVDEDLAADAGDGVDRHPPAIHQNQGVEVAKPQLRAATGVLVGVIGVARADVAATLEGRNRLAHDLQRIGVDARRFNLLRIHRGDGGGDAVRSGRQVGAGDDDLGDLGRRRRGAGLGEGSG
jgi:hypothetical protein